MDKKTRNVKVDYLLITQFNLAITFVILKLTGTITWNWLWVLCPLWIGLALWMAGSIIFLLFCLIVMVLADSIEDI